MTKKSFAVEVIFNVFSFILAFTVNTVLLIRVFRMAGDISSEHSKKMIVSREVRPSMRVQGLD